MRDISELGELMVELLEIMEPTPPNGDPNITDRAKEIIYEIAKYAVKTEIYKRSKGKAAEFWGDTGTAGSIYFHLLDRIVNAPTVVHRNAAVLIHIVPLAKSIGLNVEETEDENR